MKPKFLWSGLLLAGAALLMSCGSSTGPSVPPPAIAPEVALCSAQLYATTTQVIGTSGGSLKLGKNRFDIPPGALTVPVSITMEAVAGTARSVRFSPEGLIFNPLRLPKLKLDTKGCNLPHGMKLKIAYTSESLQILDTLSSTTGVFSGTVDADLGHFSRYAVAW